MEQLSFFSIEKKIQNAITLLKMFEAKAIEMHPEGYYLCFSGGKDSQVIYELAKQARGRTGKKKKSTRKNCCKRREDFCKGKQDQKRQSDFSF